MPLDSFPGCDDYLARLPEPYYCGFANVHWSMTMQHRMTTWLTPSFYQDFREILLHTLYRYALCCPVFCCMPDHLHMCGWAWRRGPIN